MFVMGFFRKPRAARRVELSGLGAEKLEGRALLSHVHLTPAEVATIRAEHATAHYDHIRAADTGAAGAAHGHHK
jgi:hypothetical protein